MDNLRIVRLTADHFPHPMGVTGVPCFSWQIEAVENDVHQQAFRVQIARDDRFDDLLLDTGVIESDQSVAYRPQSLALESATTYRWRVWARTNRGEATSEPARFTTGLLEGFAAQWITAEAPEDAQNDRATAVFTYVDAPEGLEAALLYASAHGVYQLFVDGKPVGDGALHPGWTSYRKRTLYQTWDLTALLTPGRHRLTAWVGSGWYKGEMTFLHTRHQYGEHACFLGQLELLRADGSRSRVVTDASWRGADAPVLFADVYNGERYDARATEPNERPVTAFSADNAVLVPQEGGAVCVHERLAAQRLFQAPNGDTVVDFGQNVAGVVRFRVRGKRGDRAVLQCIEALDAQGNPYPQNLRTAKQTIEYTLLGEGEETHRALFTYQGFRYAVLKEWPCTPEASDFTALTLYSDMSETGAFACSDNEVNRLWENIGWSMRDNFVSLPTDCPQRDERMGWTGDAQIFCETACLLRDTYAFYQNWLADVAADQTPEGGVPHVVPDTLTGAKNIGENGLLSQGTHSAAAWADAAVIIPWAVYMAYGDRDILDRQYASMRKWVEFMADHAEHYAWSYQLQFGDWVALDAEEGSYNGATPNDLVCMAYFAKSSELLANAAEVLGKAEDAKHYARLAENVRQTFRDTYFAPDGRMTVQTQTAHVLALCFRLVPDAYAAQTLDGLKALIAERGGHLCTGFVGTPLIAEALSENGALADAYALVMRRDFPSWLYQVEKGATTIWEHWDGVKPDGSMWSADMNSFNHYAYGAVGKWLFETIGGIAEHTPGYRHTMLRPRPGGGLTHASASLQTPYGALAIRWELQEAALLLTIDVPCNASAELCHPYAESVVTPLTSGRHVLLAGVDGSLRKA